MASAASALLTSLEGLVQLAGGWVQRPAIVGERTTLGMYGSCVGGCCFFTDLMLHLQLARRCLVAGRCYGIAGLQNFAAVGWYYLLVLLLICRRL